MLYINNIIKNNLIQVKDAEIKDLTEWQHWVHGFHSPKRMKGRHRVLFYLLDYAVNCKMVLLSYDTMAAQLGLSRKTIAIALKYWNESGLISWHRRANSRLRKYIPNQYYFNPVLFDEVFLKHIEYLCPRFYYHLEHLKKIATRVKSYIKLSLSFLLSQTKSFLSETYTQINNKYIYKNTKRIFGGDLQGLVNDDGTLSMDVYGLERQYDGAMQSSYYDDVVEECIGERPMPDTNTTGHFDKLKNIFTPVEEVEETCLEPVEMESALSRFKDFAKAQAGLIDSQQKGDVDMEVIMDSIMSLKHQIAQVVVEQNDIRSRILQLEQSGYAHTPTGKKLLAHYMTQMYDGNKKTEQYNERIKQFNGTITTE